MTVRTTLSQIWGNIQSLLFPFLIQEIGPLTEKHKKLIAVLELIRIEDFIRNPQWFGRPCKNRVVIARFFVAKCVYNFSYTNQLIDKLSTDVTLQRICGWGSEKIPSESTFSRAFSEFAESKLAERVHEALISDLYKGEILGHISKDSTPILAREKVAKKEPRKSIRKSRMKSDRKPFHKLTRLEQQASGKLTLEQMLQGLPAECDIGTKKRTGAMSWKGYKLHLAVDDHCIPLAAIVTSASLHDSQVGIPLAEKTNRRVKNFYDLMDSAYYTPEIIEHSKSMGHVPIVDFCPRSADEKQKYERERRRRDILHWHPAEEKRYAERMSKERANALFKETCGGRSVRYRGIKKVSSQVMFNLITITAILFLKII